MKPPEFIVHDEVLIVGPEQHVLGSPDLILDDVEELLVGVPLGEEVGGALLGLVDQGQKEEGAHRVDEGLGGGWKFRKNFIKSFDTLRFQNTHS